MTRDYPPQPWIHEADCASAPPGLLVFRAAAIPTLYPYARPHHCFDRPTVTNNRDCVAEPWSEDGDAPHPYIASTIRPPDAVRELCEECRGTHGDQAPRESIEVRLSGGGAR